MMTVFLYNQYICYESLTPTYSVQNLTLLNTVHSFDDYGFPIQSIHMLRKLNAIAYTYILAGFHNIYLLIKRRIHRACIHRVPMGNSYIYICVIFCAGCFLPCFTSSCPRSATCGRDTRQWPSLQACQGSVSLHRFASPVVLS